MPLMALTTAWERGFERQDDDLKQQLEHVHSFLDGNRELYRRGTGQGGQVDTAGYALWMLEIGGWKADETTEAVIEYLLQRDDKVDHWRNSGSRPPSEASDLSATFVAIRALKKWGTAAPARADHAAA